MNSNDAGIALIVDDACPWCGAVRCPECGGYDVCGECQAKPGIEEIQCLNQ